VRLQHLVPEDGPNTLAYVDRLELLDRILAKLFFRKVTPKSACACIRHLHSWIFRFFNEMNGIPDARRQHWFVITCSAF
jgi:hypothetical protein